MQLWEGLVRPGTVRQMLYVQYGGIMKSLHFCTPLKLQEIKTHTTFTSIRTGWIPQLFYGDEVKINERDDEKKDTLLFFAEVRSVIPILFKELGQEHQEEIARYGKKFHPEQWFFVIQFRKKKQKTLF